MGFKVGGVGGSGQDWRAWRKWEVWEFWENSGAENELGVFESNAKDANRRRSPAG